MFISVKPPFSYRRDTWEKKPMIIRRQNPEYYRGLFSTAEFDRILREVGMLSGDVAMMTSIQLGVKTILNGLVLDVYI